VKEKKKCRELEIVQHREFRSECNGSSGYSSSVAAAVFGVTVEPIQNYKHLYYVKEGSRGECLMLIFNASASSTTCMHVAVDRRAIQNNADMEQNNSKHWNRSDSS
jgi:hypothetical protein